MSARVLVVDDEPALRLTLEEALASAGLEVRTASTGAEALRAAARSPFDLVLLDLRLPDVEHLELLEKLLERRPGLAVVVITAYSTIETAVDAMQAGAADFLPKPFSPKELRETVDRALRRREEARDPARYDELLERAQVRLRARDAAGAEVHARAALALDSSRGEALNLLGVAAGLRHDVALAANYFRAALAVDPTCRAAESNLVRAIEGAAEGGFDLGGPTP